MVNSELIENIKARFQQGEKSKQIKEALLMEGWQEGDILAAFKQIQHEGLMQIPIYAKISHLLANLDEKTSKLSSRQIVFVFACIALLLLLFAFFLYYSLDPLGAEASARDKERETALIQIHAALDKYHANTNLYPSSLDQLAPQFIKSVPLDPKTKAFYPYKILDGTLDFELCVNFETQASQCISSQLTSNLPVVLDTPSPVQQTPEVQKYMINGLVYLDANLNGKRDSTEEGFKDVSLSVLDKAGVVVCSATTDVSGIFSCTLPRIGVYDVNFVPPANYHIATNKPIHIVFPDPAHPEAKIVTVILGIASNTKPQ